MHTGESGLSEITESGVVRKQDLRHIKTHAMTGVFGHDATLVPAGQTVQGSGVLNALQDEAARTTGASRNVASSICATRVRMNPRDQAKLVPIVKDSVETDGVELAVDEGGEEGGVEVRYVSPTAAARRERKQEKWKNACLIEHDAAVNEGRIRGNYQRVQVIHANAAQARAGNRSNLDTVIIAQLQRKHKLHQRSAEIEAARKLAGENVQRAKRRRDLLKQARAGTLDNVLAEVQNETGPFDDEDTNEQVDAHELSHIAQEDDARGHDMGDDQRGEDEASHSDARDVDDQDRTFSPTTSIMMDADGPHPVSPQSRGSLLSRGDTSHLIQYQRPGSQEVVDVQIMYRNGEDCASKHTAANGTHKQCWQRRSVACT